MLTTQTRLFSTAIRVLAPATTQVLSATASAAKHGSFKTFAEYRENIVKKDPQTLKARFNIMYSNGKPKECPETEEENGKFANDAKKVAYNS